MEPRCSASLSTSAGGVPHHKSLKMDHSSGDTGLVAVGGTCEHWFYSAKWVSGSVLGHLAPQDVVRKGQTMDSVRRCLPGSSVNRDRSPNSQQVIWPKASQAYGLGCSELFSQPLCTGPFALSEGVMARSVTVTKAESLTCAPWPCLWPLPLTYLHLVSCAPLMAHRIIQEHGLLVTSSLSLTSDTREE